MEQLFFVGKAYLKINSLVKTPLHEFMAVERSGLCCKLAKSSFGRHVGGQEYALQHGGQYKSYYFVEKSKCHKISPLNAFPLKFRE